MTKCLQIGSRRSPLALAQSALVHESLARTGVLAHGDASIVPMETTGDRIKVHDFTDFGGKSVFTRELDSALLRGDIDIAVHSIKDVPTHLPKGVCLAAILPRGDPREALISRSGKKLRDLPTGASVGTVSMRRAAQIRRIRNDLRPVPIRGNVATRLGLVDSGDVDATILAAVGLNRLEMSGRIIETIDTSLMLPAVGQAAIGIAVREDRSDLFDILGAINDTVSFQLVQAERSFLRHLGGDCRMPIAGNAVMCENTLQIRCEILDIDGSEVVHSSASGDPEHAEDIGSLAAHDIFGKASPRLKAQIEEHASSGIAHQGDRGDFER